MRPLGNENDKARPQNDVLLTPKEMARLLKVSVSFLAKARMSGEGPPYMLVGRSVRYSDAARQAVAQVPPAALDQ